MPLPEKTGSCSICKKKGLTEWHHIISQHHSKRTGQFDLLDNPDNVIELCPSCHRQTTASMVRKRLTKEKGPLSKPKRKAKRPARRVTVDPEERKRAVQLRRRWKQSRKDLAKRGAFRLSYSGPKRTQKQISSSLKLKGTKIEELYPPDHWLHDPKKYNEYKCKLFEGDGWCWNKKGGAERKAPSPLYRPPPSPNSKL